MTSLPSITFSLAAAFSLLACGGKTFEQRNASSSDAGTPQSEGGAKTPTTGASTPVTISPATGRPAATACVAPRPPSPSSTRPPKADDECELDADCTEGDSGRCSDDLGHRLCSYDACTTDADCGSTGVCSCRDGWLVAANVCLTNGNCRVDADCGGRERCTVSRVPGVGLVEGNEQNYGDAYGYFCTTPKDECHTNADCAHIAAEERRSVCMYSLYSHSFHCSSGI